MNQGIRIFVSGKVQGVSFRAECQKEAQRLGLFGTVKNLTEGRVEVYAVGPIAQLKELETWCHQGSLHSSVSQVDTRPDQVQTDLTGFHISY